MDFSTVFIPKDSIEVRKAAAEAYDYSQKDDLVESHLYSTAYAIKAVSISFFSTLSYFAQSIGHVISNGAELDFTAMAIDFGQDNLYALQSLLLTGFGVFYVASALLLPKDLFTHFSATPPPPPRNLLAEVATLTVQNQQLGGALYVQSQGHAHNAYMLQVERTARNVERANSLGTIAYLDAETKRISAEKAHEVYQRGYIEYQYSQLTTAKNASDGQVLLANEQLFATNQQKAQAELRVVQLAHEKGQAELQIGVLGTVIAHRTQENATAALRIHELTQQKALVEVEREHLTNVVAFRTHEKNQVSFRLAQTTREKTLADFQITDLRNQVQYNIHQKNVSAYTLAEVSDEKALVDIQLADLRNQLLYHTHQKNIAEYTLVQISHEKALAEIQVVDLRNQLLYQTHEGNVARYQAAQLGHDNVQLRAGNVQVATLQGDLHAAEARTLAVNADLAQARLEKDQADLRIGALTREKDLVEDQVRQLTHDNGQLRAGNAQVATLQQDLDQARVRMQTLTVEIAQVRDEKQQVETRALGLDGQVTQLTLEKGRLETLLSAHPQIAALQRSLEQAEARVRTLTDDLQRVSREKDTAEASVVRLTDEKAAVQEQARKFTEELRQAKEAQGVIETTVRRIEKERDETKAAVARLEAQSKQMILDLSAAAQALSAATQAKALAESAKADSLRQLDLVKAEQTKMKATLAIKSLQEVNTPEDLAAILGSMQKADPTRIPIELPVQLILHNNDTLIKDIHSSKQTLEASFTRAATEGGLAEKDKVLLNVDTVKFTNGELLFAHLSTHSPDKDSKKTFPIEVLGLVYFRQQLLEKHVLPTLKEKLDAPNLGLTLEPSNSPVVITITTHQDKTQPVTVTLEKKYLLKKHGDATDRISAAQMTGTLTFLLHKPKYEGIIQRRIQNPEEKASCVYKIDKITAVA